MTDAVFDSELNVDLLDKVMSHIETLAAFQKEGLELDEGWHQRNWRASGIASELPNCKTTMCFAGWTLELSDREYTWEDGHGYHQSPLLNGKQMLFSNEASELLGLDEEEMEELFYQSKSLEEVQETVRQIKENHKM